MSHINRHRCAVGAADLTLEVCLIVTRAEAAPRDLSGTERLRSQAPDLATRKRPPGPALSLTSLPLTSPSHRIRVPIHISQVPRD